MKREPRTEVRNRHHRRRRCRRGLALAVAAPADAHEVRDVGAYRFVVGWGTEPAFAGQENSVQLILSSRSTGKPVVSLGNTLHVDVIFGSKTMTLALEPTFDPDTGLGTPGDYRAWLFPTAPGDYTFRFRGTIGSQTIDQSFTSGPTTFNTVQDPMTAEFPVPDADVTELAQRLDAHCPVWPPRAPLRERSSWASSAWRSGPSA